MTDSLPARSYLPPLFFYLTTPLTLWISRLDDLMFRRASPYKLSPTAAAAPSTPSANSAQTLSSLDLSSTTTLYRVRMSFALAHPIEFWFCPRLFTQSISGSVLVAGLHQICKSPAVAHRIDFGFRLEHYHCYSAARLIIALTTYISNSGQLPMKSPKYSCFTAIEFASTQV